MAHFEGSGLRAGRFVVWGRANGDHCTPPTHDGVVTWVTMDVVPTQTFVHLCFLSGKKRHLAISIWPAQVGAGLVELLPSASYCRQPFG